MTTIRTLIESGLNAAGVIVRTPRGNYARVNGSIGKTVYVDGCGFKPEELTVVGDDAARLYEDAIRLIKERGLEEARAAYLRGEQQATDELSRQEAREMVQNMLEFGCKGITNMDVYELATEIATKHLGETWGKAPGITCSLRT